MRSLIVLLLTLFTGVAYAEPRESSLEETDHLPNVQNRKYRLEHEFSVHAGMLPVDAFYKGYILGGSYGWHLNDLWAIQLQGNYLLNVVTSLREKLENNFGEPPQKFAEIKMYGTAGALFKPFYGKFSFFNDQQVYGELYFSALGVVARMEGGKATEEEPSGKGPRMAFGGAPGFGLRGFLNEYFSVRFDFHTMILFSAGEIHVPIALTLNLAVTTRSDL